MPDQLTNNPEALRLFFTEDIYLVDAAHTSAEVLEITASNRENKQSVGGLEKSVPKLNSSTNAEQAPVIPTMVVPVLVTPERPALDSEAQPGPAAITATEQAAPLQQPGSTEQMASTERNASTVQGAPPQNFQYVGANQRNILILVNDDQHPVSTLQGRELLGNILKAIGLSRNDCALVNYAACDGANFDAFQRFFKPQYVFAFGVSPDQLDIPAAAYNSIVSQDGSKVILSSNLDALSNDAPTKKLLWGSLKQIQL